MAIYPKDKREIDGEAIDQPVEGVTEIRQPYRISQSISDGQLKFEFSHYDQNTGEAVYKLADMLQPEPAQEKTPGTVAREAAIERLKGLKDKFLRQRQAASEAAGRGAGPMSETDSAVIIDTLPPSAITRKEFAGRSLWEGDQRYVMLQPYSRYQGLIVYVPAD